MKALTIRTKRMKNILTRIKRISSKRFCYFPAQNDIPSPEIRQLDRKSFLFDQLALTDFKMSLDQRKDVGSPFFHLDIDQ